MKPAPILFFLLITSNLYSQYFEKVFLVDSVMPLEVCQKSIELNNGNIIAIGTNDACGACIAINYVTCLDSMGNALWLKKFIPGTTPILVDVLAEDSEIVFMTGAEDVDSVGQTMITVELYRMSVTDGSTINNNNFDLYFNQTVSSVSVKLFAQDSTYALFTGSHKVRIDHNLDTISVKNYFGGVTKPIEINNNRFATVINFNYQSIDTTALEIFDSNLDSVSLIPVSPSCYRFFKQPIWNSMHIAYGNDKYYFTSFNTPDDSVVFGCMDTLLNELWSKVSLPPTQITISDLLADSDKFYFVGENNHTAAPTGDGFLLGLNSAGDTSLYKTYRAFGYYDWNRLYHIERSSNNGFLLSGITLEPISAPRSSYILKTDSAGNTPITLSVKDIRVNAIRNFITPSVSEGYFNVNFQKESNLKIYNSTGELVYSEISKEGKTINLVSKLPGIYFAVLFSGDKIYRQKIIIQK
jgi:hypothetical protein